MNAIIITGISIARPKDMVISNSKLDWNFRSLVFNPISYLPSSDNYIILCLNGFIELVKKRFKRPFKGKSR